MTSIQKGLFTFRPHIEEWNEMKLVDKYTIFIDKFCKKWFSKYIFSFESGENSETINHFHLYFELVKVEKLQKFKDKVKRFFSKYYNISSYKNEKIAFDYTTITSTHYEKYYKGYVLKEEHKKVINLNGEVFDMSKLISYYETCVENKKIGKQKYSISKKNINVYVFNFLETFPELQEDKEYTENNVSVILDRMLEKDYWLGSISSRDLLHCIRLTVEYLNFKYFNIPSSFFQELFKKELEKEQLFC